MENCIYPRIPSAPPLYENDEPNFGFSRKKNIGMSKGEKIKNIISKYEINPELSEKLGILDRFNFEIIIDDSGSMNTPINNENTRWDKLKNILEILLEIIHIYTNDGVTINFLNRKKCEFINDVNDIQRILNEPPYGLTPLTPKLTSIFKKHELSDCKYLIIVLTDGQPTDDHGSNDLKKFNQLIKERDLNKFHISFLACSDRETEIKYLDKLKQYTNINTIREYNIEYKYLISKKGKKYKYTFGDHLIKLMVGSICDQKNQNCNIL